jgi:MOSC domain-containing protein YiiM
MKLVSVNLAAVAPLFIEQSGRTRRIITGIHKKPVAGPVQVNRLGLEGDEQADLTVHGGLNKAVYAYAMEHYPFWRQLRQAALKRDEPIAYGSMGENLTLGGLLETDLWIGDRLTIGSVVLEITEPRRPCFKFGAKMGFAHAVKSMVQSGFSGFYLRVLQTGTLQSGDAITLLPGPRKVSLAAINEQYRRGRQRDLF